MAPHRVDPAPLSPPFPPPSTDLVPLPLPFPSPSMDPTPFPPPLRPPSADSAFPTGAELEHFHHRWIWTSPPPSSQTASTINGFALPFTSFPTTEHGSRGAPPPPTARGARLPHARGTRPFSSGSDGSTRPRPCRLLYLRMYAWQLLRRRLRARTRRIRVALPPVAHGARPSGGRGTRHAAARMRQQ